MALDESAARCPPGSDLDRRMIRLRWWAAGFLGNLGDSTAQTYYQNVESVLRGRYGGSILGFGLLLVGAKLGAISGRRGATLSLLHRSIQAAHQ